MVTCLSGPDGGASACFLWLGRTYCRSQLWDTNPINKPSFRLCIYNKRPYKVMRQHFQNIKALVSVSQIQQHS